METSADVTAPPPETPPVRPETVPVPAGGPEVGTTAFKPDLAQIERALRLFAVPGYAIRLHAGGYTRVRNGRTEDVHLSRIFAAEDVAAMTAWAAAPDAHRPADWSGTAKGVYATINPIDPALIGKPTGATKDTIRARRWLLLDFDPIRPPHSNSTDAELKAALDNAEVAADLLTAWGWPEPVRAVSGNGAHLLYALDLPADDAADTLIKDVLLALEHHLRPTGVNLDTGVGLATQLCKLYGSPTKKGTATADRPYRPSYLITEPKPRVPVQRERLEQVVHLWKSLTADQEPKKPARTKTTRPPPTDCPCLYERVTDIPEGLKAAIYSYIDKMPESIGCDGAGEVPFLNVAQVLVRDFRLCRDAATSMLSWWDKRHSKDADGRPYLWQDEPEKFEHKLDAAYRSSWKCGEKLNKYLDSKRKKEVNADDHQPTAADARKPADQQPSATEQSAPADDGADIRRVEGLQPRRDWAGSPVDWTPSGVAYHSVVLADVQDAPVEFLWPGYVALKATGLVQGEPEQGKSQMTLLIAARVTTGDAMPDGTRGVTFGHPANVVLLTTEDTKELIKARMQVLGADLSRVRVITAEEATVLLPGGRFNLEALIADWSPALLVIDPLDAFLDAGINMDVATHMRRVITPLTQMAARWRMAVILVVHKAKKFSKNLLTQSIGSVAIGGGARFALNVAPMPKGLKVIKASKSSWTARPPDLYYTIEAVPTRLRLTGGTEIETTVSKVVFVDKPTREALAPVGRDNEQTKIMTQVVDALRATGEWMTRKQLAAATKLRKSDGNATDALIEALDALVADHAVLIEKQGPRKTLVYRLPVE